MTDNRTVLDIPPFPREFTKEQRLAAYWACIQLHCKIPTHPTGWYAMLNVAANRSDAIKAALTYDTPDQTTIEMHDPSVGFPE